MTECPQPLTVLYPHEHIVEGTEKMRRRLSSCGRPTLNINISIRDEHDAECPLGEVGTIALSAHGIADVRYWNRPDLRRKIEETGLFHTGDRGWMDEDGYLFIVGRSADVINSGGFNVYAFEVEETLQHHAQVAEAAVIGVPDPDWGESVLAWVVPRSVSWPSTEELIEHCRAHIASYKKPREIRYIESLPRSPTGKVDKEALRALWAVQQEGHANTMPNKQGGNDA